MNKSLNLNVGGQGPLKFKFNNAFTRTYTPTTGYFYEKTKISKVNLREDYYLLLNYRTRQCTLIFSTWAQSLTKFNPRMQDFNRVLDLN